MKKQIILLLSLLFLGILAVTAQDPIQVSGYVTNELNGEAVVNHDVHIMINDTSIYYSTVNTNQNGFYIDTIQPMGGVVNSVYIYTNDLCTFGIHDTLITGPGSVITADFEICVDSVPNPECQADFYYMPDSSNLYTMMFFDNSTSNLSIDSWFWEFGDGTTATGQNPVHTYNASGTYTVCLTITADSMSCTSISCQDVVVNGGGGGNCVADFYYVADSSFDGTVYFYDQSSPQNGIDIYTWTFGDGNTSNEPNPVHQYATPGTYNVCLTIESLDSGMMCLDTYCMNVIVNSSNPECEADFYWFPDSTQNYTVYFYDQSTPANGIISFFWTFGDGTTSNLMNPVHTYSGPGSYNVCLTIESHSGGMVICTDTLCEVITVSGGGTSCFADFYYTFDSLGSNTSTAYFYDLSTPAGLIDTWYWNFGDGTTSTEQNPVHTYTSPGTYGVCLTITADSSSCTSSHCDTIVVNVSQQYQLGGNVFAGIYELDNGFAYAYQSEGGTITNIYSEIMDTLGYYLFYPMVASDYYVKVEPSPNSAFSGQFMPTYYGDVITWAEAVLINVNQNIYTADINLVPMSQAVFGPGSISGTIMHGGTLRDNTPAVGVQVMLKNAQGEFVGLSYTNEDGVFEFNALPYDTYTLMADEAGYNMTPKDFVISEEQEMITDITMIMTDDQIYFGPSSIKTLGDVSLSDIYPNPVNDLLKLDIGVTDPTRISYKVVNQLGQIVFADQLNLEREQTLEINTSSFNSGVYFIEIITKDNHRLARRFVKF